MNVDQEISVLLERLRAWCALKSGRQAQVARYLDVWEGRVSSFLTGYRTPTLREGLLLRHFLRNHRVRVRARGDKVNQLVEVS